MTLPTKEVIEVMVSQAYNNSKIEEWNFSNWEDLTEDDKGRFRKDFMDVYNSYLYPEMEKTK